MGIFLGVIADGCSSALHADSPAAVSVYTITSATASIAAGRLAYLLGLHGPCVAYDTACSSSLTACHAALRALQLDECASSMTAGANLMLSPRTHALLAAAEMTSLRGRCHAFDQRADGYARSEAIALANLARTSEAPHGPESLPWSPWRTRPDHASLQAPTA